MDKKTLIGLSTAIIVLLSLLVPMLNVQIVPAQEIVDEYDWYIVIDGVLDSDYYSLYPYEKNSLRVGFSKFGELIGIPEGLDMTDQANWVGFEYDGRDPFCPPTVIPMTSWINGWYIDIQYIDPALPGTKRDRHVWAFAMFADGFGWGGDWIRVENPGDAPHGGRKTNGHCITEPLKVLYDGPRLFVAESVTHIYDVDGTSMWPVLDVRITLIFEKVKKQIILLKDLKITLPKMHLWGKLNVQFSNREEYDLGPEPSYDSYAQFYEQEGETCYTPEWHMADVLVRDRIQYETGDGETTTFYLDTRPVVEGFLKVWIDDVFQDPATYTVDWDAGMVKFSTPPASGAEIKFLYKYEFKDEEDWAHLYDYAQVISKDEAYVAWTAFWPPVSDYTVDGILRYLDPLYEVAEADIVTGEPKQSPLIIGEWDVALDHENVPQFRCVEVKGIANLHDALDEEFAGVNLLDREARYQLDEVFFPWDLNDAVHKKNRRWVEFDYDSTGTFTTSHGPVIEVSGDEWDQYCTFAERVIDLTENELEAREGYNWLGQDTYTVTYNPDGTMTISGLDEGHDYKILYSTDTMYSNWGDIDMEWVDEVEYADSVTISKTYTYTIIDPLGANHTLYIRMLSFTVESLTTLTENHEFTLVGTMDFYEEDFKVFKEGRTVIDCYWWDQDGPHGGRSFRHVDDDGVIRVDFWGFWMQWYITPPAGEDLHVDWLHLDVDYEITVFYNATTGNYTITTQFNVNGEGGAGLPGTKGTWIDQLYVEHIGGRYEWTVVGRDAETVDSLGAALVTAAFKNKQVEIGLAGTDMWDPVIANQIPSVMSKFGAGDEWADYLDELGRAALKDDWCTTWPIASSNLIGVGGPLANLLAYYGNDFWPAIFGLSDYAAEALANQIIAFTCWTKNTYASSEDTGYAVITTFKDLNGTVIFLIWGHWGRDTYYATKWFHEEGIYQLQEAPDCVTSIILEIDYTEHEPTVSVVEVLGTISEREWVHNGEVKGGLHDP